MRQLFLNLYHLGSTLLRIPDHYQKALYEHLSYWKRLSIYCGPKNHYKGLKIGNLCCIPVIKKRKKKGFVWIAICGGTAIAGRGRVRKQCLELCKQIHCCGEASCSLNSLRLRTCNFSAILCVDSLAIWCKHWSVQLHDNSWKKIGVLLCCAPDVWFG